MDDLERPLLANDEATPGPVLESSPSLLSLSENLRPLKPLTQVCPFILANEFCERLAFYGLATNLVNFFGGARAYALRRLSLPPYVCPSRARAPPCACRSPAQLTSASPGVMQYDKADSAAAVQSWTASCYMVRAPETAVAARLRVLTSARYPICHRRQRL